MDYDYHTQVDVDWRWTSVRVKVLGLDPMVLIIIPLLLFTGFSVWASLFSIFFVGLLIFIAITTKHGSLFTWIGYQRTRFIQGCKWEVE